MDSDALDQIGSIYIPVFSESTPVAMKFISDGVDDEDCTVVCGPWYTLRAYIR